MPAINRMASQFVAFLQNREPDRLVCNNFSLKIVKEDRVLAGHIFKYFSTKKKKKNNHDYPKLDLW